MIVISFALVKFYAFAILYVLIVMQIKLVVVVAHRKRPLLTGNLFLCDNKLLAASESCLLNHLFTLGVHLLRYLFKGGVSRNLAKFNH